MIQTVNHGLVAMAVAGVNVTLCLICNKNLVNVSRPNGAYIRQSKNTIIGLGINSSFVGSLAIVWTIASLLFIASLVTDFSDIWIKI